MFWKSIIEGLAVLAHWQVWLLAAIYMTIVFAFMFINGTLVTGKSRAGNVIGFLGYMIGGLVLQGILIGFMVFFLGPIFRGGSSLAPFGDIAFLWWRIVIAGLLAAMVTTLLCFMPLIGSIVANSPGISTFLEGIIVFRLFYKSLHSSLLTGANAQCTIYPGFWACIGYIVIVAVLVRLIMLGMVGLCVIFKDTAMGEILGTVGGTTLGALWGILGGMIPLFMYASYVRLSLFELIS